MPAGEDARGAVYVGQRVPDQPTHRRLGRREAQTSRRHALDDLARGGGGLLGGRPVGGRHGVSQCCSQATERS